MKTRSLIFALAAGGSVLFSGCSKGSQVSVEDATEVALDDSNNLQDSVTNLDAKLNSAKTEYTVEFDFGDSRNQVTVDAASGEVLSSVLI